jgi:hypothetical protein
VRQRRGTVGRVTGLAESVAAAVRRRQQERDPRVLLYDASGYPRVLPPDAEAHAELVAVAARMVELGTLEAEPAMEDEDLLDREAVAGASPLPETDPDQD